MSALDVLLEEVTKLKDHMGHDGEYSLRRFDGESMGIGEVIMLGDIFEKIDNAILESPKELSSFRARIAELEAENKELRKPAVIWGEKLRNPPEQP